MGRLRRGRAPAHRLMTSANRGTGEPAGVRPVSKSTAARGLRAIHADAHGISRPSRPSFPLLAGFSLDSIWHRLSDTVSAPGKEERRPSRPASSPPRCEQPAVRRDLRAIAEASMTSRPWPRYSTGCGAMSMSLAPWGFANAGITIGQRQQAMAQRPRGRSDQDRQCRERSACGVPKAERDAAGG